MRILNLSLNKKPFDLMVTGEKKYEFRKPYGWVKSRLINKDYDIVKFTNGRGSNRRSFTCEYLRNYVTEESFTLTYSNEFCINVEKGDFIICLGNVLEVENYNT